jgi:AcrR family transcriptional regulator
VAEQEIRDPVWARETVRRRTTLTRDAIVQAAVALADAEGIEAVSIRRVATELGARAMSIYTYIDRKEDLLELMADEVAADVLVPGELPADWREATLTIARRERAAVRRHPWLIDLVARRSTAGHVGPNMLRHLEQSLAALTTLDATREWRLRLMTAVADYTTGFAVREARAAEPGLAEPYVQELLAGGEFPQLAALLAGGPPSAGDDNFEQGLRFILDGLESRLRPR